jgi:hypothetical protein
VHLTGLRRADRGGDVGGVRVLEEVPGGAGLERSPDLRLLDEGGDGDDLDIGQRRLISAVAVTPSMAGIWRSMRTTSGRCPPRSRTAIPGSVAR